MQMTMIESVKTSPARRELPRYWLRRATRRAIDLLRAWRQRRDSRIALARFDERMLRDIGITRADALREANKPFWRN